MLVDLHALIEFRDSIEFDNDGNPFVWGPFDQLWSAVHMTSALDVGSQVSRVRGRLTPTLNRLEDLRTIAAKLDWMLALLQKGELAKEAWMYFASSDVVSYLTSTRSLMDHLAGVLAAAAPQASNVPNRSFNKQQRWLFKNPDRHEQFGGPGLAALVTGCDWFAEAKELRDDLVHHTARPLVFPTLSGIRFQIYDGVEMKLTREPEMMVTENMVSFEFLAAAIAARLNQLLSACARILIPQLGLTDEMGTGYSYHPGLGTLAKWSDELVTSLDGGQ